MEASRRNPVLHAVVQKSAVIYDEIPLRDFISEETRAELGRELFLEINGICNAAEPVMACRDKLASTMLRFAAYQVLMIPPPPEEDPSGLRGQPGITGELKEKLVQVVQKKRWFAYRDVRGNGFKIVRDAVGDSATIVLDFILVPRDLRCSQDRDE